MLTVDFVFSAAELSALGLKTVKFNILSSGWFIILAQMGLHDHQLFLY